MGTLQKGKTVLMYRNGDSFFPPKPIVLNVHETRNWDSFLDKVTNQVRCSDAIQIIYDANTGKRVRQFNEFEDGKSYVAAKKRFKKRNYNSITDAVTKQKAYKRPHMHTRRVVASGRAKKLAFGVRGHSILVTLNGDVNFKPVRILINKRTIPDFVHLFDEITRKFRQQMPVIITRLYDTNGHKMKSLEELTDKGKYVASARGRFKPMPYFSGGVLTHTAPTNLKSKPSKNSPRKLQPMHRRSQTLNPSDINTNVVRNSNNNRPQNTNASSDSPVKEVKKIPKTMQKKKKLEDNERVQSYNVNVITGDDQGNGTDANVFITLHGTKGNSSRVPLREDSDNFMIGGDDVFAIENPSVGQIESMTVEHDDSGASSAWFLKMVSVRDTVSKKKVFFHYNNWLASDRGNMTCKVRLKASDSPTPPKNTLQHVVDDFASSKHEHADIVEDSDETMNENHNDDEEDNAHADTVDEEEGDIPSITTKKFKKETKTINAALNDVKELKSYWKQLDFNGNNIVSLAEIDKFVGERFPALNNKPALMRAYKQTTLKDGDKDAWVEKKEFPFLLRNLLYFNVLFDTFDDIDTDDDRRVDFKEFKQGMGVLNIELDDVDAQAEFAAMDANDGGVVLFDEFAAWAATRACPVNDNIVTTFTTADDRPID
eukprot:m.148755 g.148755  ORF g.148755 m.148755 type:complete len:656 (-) comp13263_c1_seq2:106-2073(-)